MQFQPPQQQQAQTGFQDYPAAERKVQSSPPQSSAWDLQPLQNTLLTQNTTSTTQQSRKTPMPTPAPVHQSVAISEGGKARRHAASQGTQTLTQFDELVTRTLTSSGICAHGRTWHRTEHGYLCEEARCFVRNKDIDSWALSGGQGFPRFLGVNCSKRWSWTEWFPIKTALHPPRGASGGAQALHALFVDTLEEDEPHYFGPGVCRCVMESGMIEDTDKRRADFVLLGEADLDDLPEAEEKELPWR